jgi:hypothetical protein
METQQERSTRLRKHLCWQDNSGTGITNNEAIKKLHTGKGGEAKVVGGHLDENASDSGGLRRLDKTGKGW